MFDRVGPLRIEQRKVDVERLEAVGALDLQRRDALCVVVPVGSGQRQHVFEDRLRGNAVDGVAEGAGRQARAVVRDHHPAIQPHEPKGRKMAAARQRLDDCAGLVVKVGIAVPATDRRGKTHEGQEGLDRRLIVIESTVKVREAAGHLLVRL